ncbi:MAG: universal stress protein [Crocinitomicaceae bacterium]
MSKNLYIVPYDFTPVSDKAVEYALFLGGHIATEIRLVHFTTDKTKAFERTKEIDKAIEGLNIPSTVEVTSLVKVGDVFSDLGKIAKQERAQLIIMGTHGMKGFQRLSGSHAMKVVTSAEVPFLVVQKDTQIMEIENIMVPVDLTKESLQIVSIAGDMANIFKSKVHVLAEKQADEMLNTRINIRTGIVSKEYEERSINSEMCFLNSSGNYGKKIINYVEENNGGLIAIAYHSESLLPQFDSFAQDLITNKLGLPVLIVNSKLASALYF